MAVEHGTAGLCDVLATCLIAKGRAGLLTVSRPHGPVAVGPTVTSVTASRCYVLTPLEKRTQGPGLQSAPET